MHQSGGGHGDVEASGTIPPPGRVPGRSSDLCQIGADDGDGSGPVEEKVISRIEFLGHGDIYGRKT